MKLSDEELRQKNLTELFAYFKKEHPTWNGEQAVAEIRRIRGNDDLSGEFSDLVQNKIRFWQIGAIVMVIVIIVLLLTR